MGGLDWREPMLWGWAAIGIFLIVIGVDYGVRVWRRRAVRLSVRTTAELPEIMELLEEDAPPTEPTIGYTELKDRFDQQSAHWMARYDVFKLRLRAIRGISFEAMPLVQLLENATDQEKANLGKLLQIDGSSSPAALGLALRRAGSHSMMTLIRGEGVPYEEVARDVAGKLGGKPSAGARADALERLAIASALEKVWEKATPEQRQELVTALAKEHGIPTKGLLTAAGGLALANLSGFGLYLAASTVLGALTSTLGIVLPFAIYTGMSSMLAAATGPLGWALLGVWALAALGGANYKVTIPSVISVAAIRLRLIAERDLAVADVLRERRDALAAEQDYLDLLSAFLQQMRRNGIDYPIPLSSVPRFP